MGERKQPLLSRHNIIISAFVFSFFSLPFHLRFLINMQVQWWRHQKSFPVHRVGVTLGWVVAGRLGAMATRLRKRTPGLSFFFFCAGRRSICHQQVTDEVLVLGLPQQTRLIGRRVAPENTAKNNPLWRRRHFTNKSCYDAAFRKKPRCCHF